MEDYKEPELSNGNYFIERTGDNLNVYYPGEETPSMRIPGGEESFRFNELFKERLRLSDSEIEEIKGLQDGDFTNIYAAVPMAVEQEAVLEDSNLKNHQLLQYDVAEGSSVSIGEVKVGEGPAITESFDQSRLGANAILNEEPLLPKPEVERTYNAPSGPMQSLSN